MESLNLKLNGASFHVVGAGSGPALLLLHGWPEFWLTWKPIMDRLCCRYTLIAPDLKGFGDSAKPEGSYGTAAHARDIIALLATLEIVQAGIVGHDVGGAVIQELARSVPERCVGLFLLDFVYPGIGQRMAHPEHLKEIWYQSFNQTDLAIELVGASRLNCKAYISHFLRHWAHHKGAFDDVLDAFVDNFMKPGNLPGGFAHYRAAEAEGRIAMMKGEKSSLPPISVPTCVRWAQFDPIFPYAWTDRLFETFSNLDLAMFPEVGHFAHREAPDRTAREIDAFFNRIGWRGTAGRNLS